MHSNLVVLFTILSIALAVFTSAEEWSHSASLSGSGVVHVHWRVEGENITFKVEARAKGYVGFGLSKTGGMAGSDIVTGWVVDGKVFFQDRYATGLTLPPVDEKQDWDLLEGSENETHTVLKFQRKLNTCDDKDMEIDESTIRLIYAYSDVDPPSPEGLQYHHDKRGSRSVMLLQPKRQKDIPTEDVLYWDVLSPNYTLTSTERSAYFCNYFKGPELATKHHIIKIEPLMSPRGEDFVHHIVMYECIDGDPEHLEHFVKQPGHYCYQENMPEDMKRCEGIIAAWAVGGEALIFPENVGLPLNSSPPKYYLLEMHYDNSLLLEDITDWSGLRLHYTPHLREMDAGTWMIGSVVSPRVFIPPRQEAYTVVGHANPECFQSLMPPEGVKVIGVILHAHLLGRHLKARHFRNNVELKPLAENANYDFNYQEYVILPEEVTVLPGDQITMECTYNSQGREKVTFNGLTTEDEMCLVFVLYYPRIERFGCMSGANLTLISELTGINNMSSNSFSDEYYTSLLELDWSSIDIKALEIGTKLSPHKTFCYTGDGDKSSVQATSSYPYGYKPYMKEDKCRNYPKMHSLETGSSSGRSSGRKERAPLILEILGISMIAVFCVKKCVMAY